MKKVLVSILIILLANVSANTQVALRVKEFNLEKNLAIQGYDLIAYFSYNKAIKGKAQFTANIEGVTYNFTSAANKDLFVKDYKKNDLQYGL